MILKFGYIQYLITKLFLQVKSFDHIIRICSDAKALQTELVVLFPRVEKTVGLVGIHTTFNCISGIITDVQHK